MRILIVLLAIAWASPTLAAHKKHRSKDRDEHYQFVICSSDNPRRCLVLSDE
jgi:hypothetical protein